MAPSGGDAGQGLFSTLLMFALIVGIFYYLILKPHKRKKIIQDKAEQQKAENEKVRLEQERRIFAEHESMKAEIARLKKSRSEATENTDLPAARSGELLHSDQYSIVRELGQGGMGTVYLAEDRMLDRHVALKVLSPSLTRDPKFVERFRQEAKIQSSLVHPNVVSLYTFFNDGGTYWMVMEYVEGQTVKHLIEGHGAMEELRAKTVIREILEGVEYAHRRGIIHRDVKPGNIIVTADGSVKIMDFGVAKILGNQGLTRTGAKVGTIYYMSPEQVRGEKDIDHRTDIYSIGATFFEMLTGRRPFDDDTDSDFVIMEQILERPFPSVRDLNPGISEKTSRLISRMTEKARDLRPSSCAECARMLGSA